MDVLSIDVRILNWTPSSHVTLFSTMIECQLVENGMFLKTDNQVQVLLQITTCLKMPTTSLLRTATPYGHPTVGPACVNMTRDKFILLL